jgi:hypothetical protein
LQELCRRSGKSFKEVVNELLRVGLLEETKREPCKPFRVNARPMRARRGIDLDNVGDLLEQIEGPAHK